MQIKSYTDLEQSKVLAEILPIESADMRYGYIAPYDYSDRMYDGGYDEVPYPKDFLKRNPNFSENEYDGELPCWSLAALISILPDEIKHDGIVNNLWITSKDVSYYSIEYESYLYYEEGCTIDACVEMILKLHELNLL